MKKCKKCNVEIKTYNKRRKWCFDCRKKRQSELLKLRRQLMIYIKDFKKRRELIREFKLEWSYNDL